MAFFLIRKIIHFLFGIVAIILLYWLPKLSSYLFVLVAILFVIFDLWRRVEGKWRKYFYKTFDKLLKSSESRGRITAATTFLMTVAGLSLSFPREILVPSILILSVSDPLASITGKFFPIKKIWKEKSLMGSIIFLLCSLLIYQFFVAASVIPLLFAALLVTFIELFAPEILENILVGFGAGMVVFIING